MAGIYTRDNINYSQMLQNAITNRAKSAEIQAAYKQAQGKLWGDTATNIGKYLGRGIFATADSMSDEDEAELARLKEIKAEQEQKSYEEEIKKAYEEQLEQRNKFDNIFANPNYGIYNPKYNKPQGPSLSEEGTIGMQGYEPNFMYHNDDFDNDDYYDWYHDTYNSNPYTRYLAGRRGY